MTTKTKRTLALVNWLVGAPTPASPQMRVLVPAEAFVFAYRRMSDDAFWDHDGLVFRLDFGTQPETP